jgi:hypothetical protein
VRSRRAPTWGKVAARAEKDVARIRGTPNFRSLTKYTLEKKAIPRIESVVRESLRAGDSALELRRKIVQQLIVKDERLSFLLAEDTRDIAKGLEAVTGISARTILYDTRRIAISETNNYMRSTNIESMREGGIIEAARWTTNPGHTSTDECDDLANEDTGWGPGFYALADYPDAPHPFCACPPGEVIFKDESEW